MQVKSSQISAPARRTSYKTAPPVQAYMYSVYIYIIVGTTLYMTHFTTLGKERREIRDSKATTSNWEIWEWTWTFWDFF